MNHGRSTNRPRFKSKHRSRDSFRIHHHVHKPDIRPDTGYRRIRYRAPTRISARARLHQAALPSHRPGRGHPVRHHQPRRPPLVRQHPHQNPHGRSRPDATPASSRHAVGVDVSVPTTWPPCPTARSSTTPVSSTTPAAASPKPQRALSRTQKGSARRRRAAARVGRLTTKSPNSASPPCIPSLNNSPPAGPPSRSRISTSPA